MRCLPALRHRRASLFCGQSVYQTEIYAANDIVCKQGKEHGVEQKYCSFDDLPIVLKVEDLMPILGIGRNTAYELARSGKIRCIRIGRQLRIPKDAVIEYLCELSNNKPLNELTKPSC